MLPPVLKFNAAAAEDLYAEMAAHMGLEASSSGLIAEMERIADATGIETRLSQLGISHNDIPRMAEDVAANAVSAAFRDPRFTAMTTREWPQTDIHISVLSEPKAMQVSSREDLLGQLRPGVDGLILIEGQHRSTYLPSVWTQLPDPADFVSELRRKAGLPAAGWSSETRVLRYTTFEFA